MALNIPPYLVSIGSAKAAKAKEEFNKLVNEVAGENIIGQITAAGKTKLIADALKDVVYYGSQGSLWEVYSAIEKIEITPEMAPFLTEERKQLLKNRVIQIISSL
jgi:hypothetical protein